MISFSPQERGNEAVTTGFALAASGFDGPALFDLLSYATIVFSLARGDSNSYDLLNRKASCRLNDAPVAPQGVEPCSAE